MTAPTPRSWLPAYVATGIVWGCSFLFIKYSLGFLTPFGVAFMRCALGALTLLLIAAIKRVALPKEFIVWCRLWVVAMCLNIVPGVLFALAETRTTSIVAGIINALTPLTSLFFILIVFRDDEMKPFQLVGLGVGLVGVLVVLGVWQGFGTNPWWAVVALLGAVTLYGVSFPYTRRYLIPRGLAPVSLASAQLLLAALTLLPTFLLSRHRRGGQLHRQHRDVFDTRRRGRRWRYLLERAAGVVRAGGRRDRVIRSRDRARSDSSRRCEVDSQP